MFQLPVFHLLRLVKILLANIKAIYPLEPVVEPVLNVFER